MPPVLAPQDLKALEQLRQRLSQLTNSITTLQRDLNNAETLPPWPQLTSLLSIIAQNLSQVNAAQSQHADLLSSLAVYPLPEFPGRTEEGLLNQLLRKKLEPAVEDWVDKGRVAGAAVNAAKTSSEGLQSTGINAARLKELWEWAGGAANDQARSHHWGGDYTREEVAEGVENVATGLKRKLRIPGDDDDSSEEEDEDLDDGQEDRVTLRRGSTGQGVELDITREKKEEEHKPLPLNEYLRFMMTGQTPRRTTA